MLPGENAGYFLAGYNVWTFSPGAALIFGIKTPSFCNKVLKLSNALLPLILASIARKVPLQLQS
jgi:hypothetical protein